MDKRDPDFEIDEQTYKEIEDAFVEQNLREQRYHLFQLKQEKDLDRRTQKLGRLLTSLSPVQACDLLESAYRLAVAYSAIGESVLLSSLQIDRIWAQHGLVVLQGIFDELQTRRQYDLQRILINSLIFREHSHIFCSIVLYFHNLSYLFYEATEDKRFHLNLPTVIRKLQEICKKQGLRTIKFELESFFADFFNLELSDEIADRVVPILFEKKFSHLQGNILYHDTSELLPEDLSAELIPNVFEMDIDITSWETILTESLTPKADDIVIEARKVFSHLRTGERVEMARKVRDGELKLLLYDQSPIVIEALLENSRLTEIEVSNLAYRQTTAGEILNKIAENNSWFCRYTIKNAIAKNQNTAVDLALKILPDLLQNDLIDIVNKSGLSWMVRRSAYKQLQLKLSRSLVAEQIEMARYAGPIIIEIMLNSRDERFITTLLYHDRLQEKDITRIINWPDTNPLILERIGKHIYWSEAHSIKVGLLHHPSTPPAIKTRFLDDLSFQELQILSLDHKLDDSFRSLVLRRLEGFADTGVSANDL